VVGWEEGAEEVDGGGAKRRSARAGLARERGSGFGFEAEGANASVWARRVGVAATSWRACS
jgi:hypothetical protein